MKYKYMLFSLGCLFYNIGIVFGKEKSAMAFDSFIWYKISVAVIFILILVTTKEKMPKKISLHHKKEVLYNSDIISQRSNYIKCSNCKTENSNGREKCYFCGDNL